MPIAYVIPGGRSVLEISLSGNVTSDDFRSFFLQTEQDPDYRPDLDRVVIVENVVAFPPVEEIKGIASRIRDRVAETECRFAIVAVDPLAIGIANMLLRHAGLAGRYAIVASRDEAAVWLR